MATLIALIIGFVIGYLMSTCSMIEELDEMSVSDFKTLKREIDIAQNELGS
jgi:uncharacterized membrane-anchored protein YhcB (DUF1043 family)